MGCCGKSRVSFQMPAAIVSPPVGTVAFEYSGTTRLTVIGPVTRVRYDFSAFGARLNVDRRDSNAIADVPSLRRVP
jgi:hypothetical protein